MPSAFWGILPPQEVEEAEGRGYSRSVMTAKMEDQDMRSRPLKLEGEILLRGSGPGERVIFSNKSADACG